MAVFATTISINQDAAGYRTYTLSDSSSLTLYQIYNNDPTGSLIISGTAAEDQTLTLTSTVADADGIDADTVSYQWLRDGSAISSATSSTYVLTQDDVGANISASVSYIDGYGNAEVVTSGATSAVVNVNDAPVVRYEIDAFSFDYQDGYDAEAVTGIFFDTSGILSFLGTADATISYTYDDQSIK